MGPENAYLLLGLDIARSSEITLDDIRAAYKRRAMLVHPDKPNGSEKAFGLMFLAYKALMDLHTHVTDKHITKEETANRLNAVTETHDVEQQQQHMKTSCYQGGRFDARLFNESFQRDQTPYDKGYNDFFCTSSHSDRGSRPDIIAPLSTRPVSLPPSTHLIKYTEPRAMNGFGCSDMACLDKDAQISDFSGENLCAKRLQFTDLQLAHTTEKIAEESFADDRLNFDNVDSLTAYRNSQLDRIAYKTDFLA